MYLLDAPQAMGFLISQTANIEAEVYKIRYPDYNYADFVDVVTEGNEWARSTTFFGVDFTGTMDWISGSANDIPYVELNRSKGERSFFMKGAGYQWNLEEVSVAAMTGVNLSADKAEACRRVSERTLFQLAMSGDTEKNWTGLINDAAVTAGNVPADGTGSATTFASKTPDQILRDINTGITGIFTNTLEVEMANTVLLPTTQFNYIASTPRSSTSDTTILSYLQANNVYTAQTGQRLNIRSLRTLAGAGAGGTNRMVIYRKARDVVRLHLPMPFRFLPVWQNGPMNWMVPGILRSGGVEIRLPKAVRYLDGI